MKGDVVRTLGSLVAIIMAVMGAATYVWSLAGRVSQLESQIHILTVSPVIAAAAEGQSSRVAVNPVAQA